MFGEALKKIKNDENYKKEHLAIPKYSGKFISEGQKQFVRDRVAQSLNT
jgi:hypothetical protein